ncbi:hypothetical protein GCM10011575_06080 [Microlunatus endophyticus]|uniref:Uncharacterized protein n=1 Tax=Microlunatus endophyticus TaxID=1716077 RepID=A0A917W1P8_9ACTN|nr:hypothetical protein GCM10011575_06080 [Microlunatus endophyticus]
MITTTFAVVSLLLSTGAAPASAINTDPGPGGRTKWPTGCKRVHKKAKSGSFTSAYSVSAYATFCYKKGKITTIKGPHFVKNSGGPIVEIYESRTGKYAWANYRKFNAFYKVYYEVRTNDQDGPHETDGYVFLYANANGHAWTKTKVA